MVLVDAVLGQSGIRLVEFFLFLLCFLPVYVCAVRVNTHRSEAYLTMTTVGTALALPSKYYCAGWLDTRRFVSSNISSKGLEWRSSRYARNANSYF
uniref:Uncharacterized protein n=1 Tax=Anopheles darlingi TaxID=43151 RepID=A0A2M4DCI0_ANODA